MPTKLTGKLTGKAEVTNRWGEVGSWQQSKYSVAICDTNQFPFPTNEVSKITGWKLTRRFKMTCEGNSTRDSFI